MSDKRAKVIDLRVVCKFLVIAMSGLKNKILCKENPSTLFLISAVKFFLDAKYFDAKIL